MNYYYFFRPAMGPSSGKKDIMYIFRKKLENFISYIDLGEWFNLNGIELASPLKVDEVLDLKNNPNISLILILVSPYKRAFQYYLSHLGLDHNLTIYKEHPDLTPEKFTEFLLSGKVTESQKINVSTIYEEGGIKIHYVVDYDNLIEDLRKIPGLEDIPDDFLAENIKVMDDYKIVYTDDARKWVEETYAKDIQTYGHTF